MLNILLSIGAIWLLYKLFRFYLKTIHVIFKDTLKKLGK